MTQHDIGAERIKCRFCMRANEIAASGASNDEKNRMLDELFDLGDRVKHTRALYGRKRRGWK